MTVLGLDSCKGGWVVVAANQAGLVDLFVARSVVETEQIGLSRWGVTTMVIDIPIGLADDTPRTADRLAKARIGPRGSSVFDVPIRPAIEAGTLAEADRLSRAANGAGVGSMSYALRDKLLEVDEFKDRAHVTVCEGHPEVSFAALAGRHLEFYKKTLAGAHERRALLDAVGLTTPIDAEATLSKAKGIKAGFDDVHDAAVMAWTALRVEAGSAESVPSPPQVFSDGWPSAIWY